MFASYGGFEPWIDEIDINLLDFNPEDPEFQRLSMRKQEIILETVENLKLKR